MSTTTTPTRSQGVGADVAALWRARNPLLWVVTGEEARVEKYLFEAAASAGYLARTWDIAQGITSIDGSRDLAFDGSEPAEAALNIIREQKGTKDNPNRGVWIMRDLPVWLKDPMTLRSLRNLARWLPGQPRWSAQAIVVLSPSAEVPPELVGHAKVIEWPLPDRAEIAALLDATVASLPKELQQNAVNGQRDAAIDAAVGLSGEEAQACFAQSVVQTRTIDPATIASEKKRIIARSGVLEWIDPLPGGLDAVGGLDVLKAWLVSRASAWTPAAREYGLQAPKGALLVGVPGCGKSHTFKAVAAAWNVPLIRLDLGGLRGKFVGESEGNLRKALSTIEAIGPCVVAVDEIEKALAGSQGEAGDGGVAADALGTLLSWMQDRSGEAFVIATANDASKLPPELLRKGRFDEMFWVDVPTGVEREQIVAATLRTKGRDAEVLGIDLVAIADATDTFTGAELASLVPEAMFAAFADDAREITTDDLLAVAKTVMPQAATPAGARIDAQRKEWVGRARLASSAPRATTTADSPVPVLDLA